MINVLVIALLGVSSGTPPPIRTAYLDPEIGDLQGRGRRRKRALRRPTRFRESWDPVCCTACSGLRADAFEPFPGLGPRRLAPGKPSPQTRRNPWKQENPLLENTTIVTTAVQNHSSKDTKISRQKDDKNQCICIYKILINYKGKSTMLGCRNLPELP